MLKTGLLLLLILLLAAALRLAGLDWDGYHHYHPDERYITWVATTIEWPEEWSSALDPIRSSFNPFYWPPDAASTGIEVLQDERRDFAYGHLPLYLGVLATRLVERIPAALADTLPAGWLLTRDLLNARGAVEFRHLTAVSRALTALVDTGTVLLTFLLGRRLFNARTGLLAAAFLALAPLHIQLAHFFTADPYLTFFTVAALYAMVVFATAGEPTAASPLRRYLPLLLAAVLIGLAVGSKFTAVLLFLPLAVTLLLDGPFNDWRFLGRLLLLALVAALTFVITNPFAVLDLHCPVVSPALALGPVTLPAIDWRSCYLENVVTQGLMVRGAIDLAFTRQYSGTLPFLYFIEMQVRWGLGPLLGLLTFGAFGWAVWRAGRSLLPAAERLPPGEWVLLAWTVPYFLFTGSLYVKFMRYMQPLIPFLLVYAATLLWRLRPAGLRRALIALTLLFTALYAFGLTNVYAQTHPWVAASQWIHRHVPAGLLILTEQWDEPLPTSLDVDGRFQSRFRYEAAELTWLSGPDEFDDQEKLQANLERLAQADYLVLASNRVYGVVPRLPERYPLSGQYHPLLFAGRLGYEPVYVSGRFPGLPGLYLRPDTFGWPDLQPPEFVAGFLSEVPGLSGGRADESFIVYDQPLTIIFQNTGRLSAAEMLAEFEPFPAGAENR